MKRSRLPRSSPEQIREWRRRSAKAQGDRAREKHGHKFRTIGPKRRTKAERDEKFAREYGSVERVRAIKALPCTYCGRGPCDNAHVTNGGTGRKAHHSKIIPACRDREGPHGPIPGCHWEMDHGIGKDAMDRRFKVDRFAEARRIHALMEERGLNP